MDALQEKIPGIEISPNEKSKRIINIKIKEEILDKLIFPFHKFTIQALEYKPFTRFTIAKSLDELFLNKFSKLIHFILADRNTGCFMVVPEVVNKKFDDTFLVKLSTSIAHLIGTANFDDMTSKYYARFFVKHEDNSDSYLRKAYTNMDLHTDGTYVKEKTDWLLMTKLEEKNAEGGESVMLHLDDWEHCEELSNDPAGWHAIYFKCASGNSGVFAQRRAFGALELRSASRARSERSGGDKWYVPRQTMLPPGTLLSLAPSYSRRHQTCIVSTPPILITGPSLRINHPWVYLYI